MEGVEQNGQIQTQIGPLAKHIGKEIGNKGTSSIRVGIIHRMFLPFGYCSPMLMHKSKVCQISLRLGNTPMSIAKVAC